MDRQQNPPSSQQQGQREMVYCHECENEWFRDEHGLTCPDCHSDFTEIIEPDHDPRTELGGDDENDEHDMHDASHHPLHGHNPWLEIGDPSEGDINTIRWQQTEPGRYTATATIFRSFSPSGHTHRHGEESHNGPNPPDLTRNFISMLSGIIGGRPRAPEAGQDQGQTGSNATGTETEAGAGNESRTQSQRSGGPNIEFFGGTGNGSRFTYHTTARIFPRDANSPQPHIEPVDELSHVIGTLMMGLGPPGGPFSAGGNQDHAEEHHPFTPNPLAALFATMLNPGLARQGDIVYTQEALDRVISQLMEQNATGNAPGPASADAIAALPKRKIGIEDLGNDGRAECSICMDEVNVGDDVTVLPCTHWFHGQCVGAWLGEHDTCPHCRKGIMGKSDNNGRHNTASGNPAAANASESQASSSSSATPGAGSGAGTSQNPFITVVSPAEQGHSSGPRPSLNRHPSHGSSSSTGEPSEGGGGGGGIGDRIRRTLFGSGH